MQQKSYTRKWHQLRRYYLFVICPFIVLNVGCNKNTESLESQAPKLLHQSVDIYTDVIVHDIFSPPAASRNYAYPLIAAYETMALFDTNYLSLAGQLHEFDPAGIIIEDDLSPSVAILEAFLETAKHFVYTTKALDAHDDQFLEIYADSRISKDVIAKSIALGQVMSNHIIKWSKNDNYDKTRSYPKYAVTDVPGRWKPTPPGYIAAIEPHWRDIRSFVLDSANQFIPKPPTPFNLEKDSKYYQEVMEVYNIGNQSNMEEKSIAAFWDCNPYVMNVSGHVMYASKKITPGGHWIGITGLACQKANFNLSKSLAAYVYASIALADGFINCWDEKYRSNLIRPETIINEHIDKNWQPLLQTPPFPEHTSGHSVISNAAAVALTHVFGENFAFEDTVEVKYGLPSRSFSSFTEASEEAAISRLYGGIHYRPAIDDGVTQGRQVGELVVQRLKLRASR